MNSPATLHGEKVKLIPYAPVFDEQTIQWLNDPAVYEDFGLTRRLTLESHRNWLTSQKDYVMWAILGSEGQHQGNVSLQVTPRHGSAYLQIYIGNKQARGQGLGWDSLKSVLDYAFSELKLHRIWLHVLPGKDAAAHLYRKAGFIEEGLERDATLWQGTFRSQLRMSLLEPEWRQVKSRLGLSVSTS